MLFFIYIFETLYVKIIYISLNFMKKHNPPLLEQPRPIFLVGVGRAKGRSKGRGRGRGG